MVEVGQPTNPRNRNGMSLKQSCRSARAVFWMRRKPYCIAPLASNSSKSSFTTMLQGGRFALFHHSPPICPSCISSSLSPSFSAVPQFIKFCPSPPIRTRRNHLGERTSSAALRLSAPPELTTLRLITFVFLAGLVSPGLKTFSGSSQLKSGQYK